MDLRGDYRHADDTKCRRARDEAADGSAVPVCRDEAAKQNVPVAIVIGSKQFARLIQYAGLSHAFRIFDNRAEALMDLSQAGTE